MADFRTRTPAIDPQAFANVLQRKAQMEQEQINVEDQRRTDRIKGLMEAVVTGQNIASNMMTIADKKNKLRQAEEEKVAQENIARLAKTPLQPDLPADLSPDGYERAIKVAEQNRQRELEAALAKSSSRDKYNESLIKQILPDGREETARDLDIRSLFDPKTNQVVDYIVNKHTKTVTTLSGTPVPKETADTLLRGYAPKEMKDQFGNPTITPSIPGLQASSASRATMEEGGIPALQATAPVLAERFTAARDKAFPAYNQQLKEATDSAASAGIVSRILEQPEINEVGLKSLGFHLARMSGSNSQLSDQERQTFEQPLALVERAKNFGYKNIIGDLSPKMRQDLLQLSKLVSRKEKIRGHKAILAAKQNAKGQVGKSRYEKFQLDKEFPSIDDLITQSADYVEAGNDDDTLIEDLFK